MDAEWAGWWSARTWDAPPWTADGLRARKGGRTVSAVLPALNEERTVGAVVAALVPLATGPAPLLDEIVVVDSGSTDATRRAARDAGARVVTRERALPGVDVRPGKGEVLWRSLAATSGDIVVFLDSDLVDVDAEFVVALLGPLLTTDGVRLVKGFYRRPLRIESELLDTGGGRVTELLVRPLLAALRPDLSGVVQPLGGEYAACRDLLESLPFAAGYGVEIGLLIDTVDSSGLDAVAQVNLGVRKHRNRPLPALGMMARQILGALLARVGVPDGDGPLVQFRQVAGEWLPQVHDVDVRDRPPMHRVRPRPAPAGGLPAARPHPAAGTPRPADPPATE